LKLLLLGKNGQLGRELERSLAPLGELVALGRHSTDFCGNLADPEGLAGTVRKLRPDVIVNAAAYTAVDRAEREPELADRINAEAPALLAQEAAKLGAWLVHYSTDYVFDGSGSRAWRESDVPAPLNVYGRSKLEGERRVRAACPKHLVFRTGWVYGEGNNFLTAVLRLGQQQERIEVVDDQFGAPTSARMLAEVSARAIDAAMRRPGLAGLYHLAAAGEASRYGYALHILGYLRRFPSAIEIVTRELVPVPSHSLKAAALRPLNGRLDCSKISGALDLVLPRWESGVDTVLERLIGNPPATR
jgi:dTDP-4-dehydrorhamnose reductase